MWPKSVWITRKGVERLLGVDKSKVRRMQDAGELPFVRDERGVSRFPLKEIEEMAQARGRIIGVPPGPVAAKVFALLAQGKTWQEVMIALGQLGMAQPVEVVRKLHEQFLDQDKRASTPVFRHARGPIQPESAREDEAVGEDVPTTADTDEWQRLQDETRRRAQADQDRDQREWEHAQRARAEEAARHIMAGRPSLAKATAGDEGPPLSERIALILQLLSQNPSR
jgi:hypothetical protein